MSLEPIGTEVPTLPLELTYRRTLEYYDGDLLTECLGPQGETYLYAWVDCDHSRHRWMVYPVVPDMLAAYLRGELTYLKLIMTCVDGRVYLVDHGAGNRVVRVAALPVEDLPESYLPAEHCLHDFAPEEPR